MVLAGSRVAGESHQEADPFQETHREVDRGQVSHRVGNPGQAIHRVADQVVGHGLANHRAVHRAASVRCGAVCPRGAAGNRVAEIRPAEGLESRPVATQADQGGSQEAEAEAILQERTFFSKRVWPPLEPRRTGITGRPCGAVAPLNLRRCVATNSE